MEVKLGVCVLEVQHVVTRVVAQVRVVVVAHHLDDNLLVEVARDLEVSFGELLVPQLRAVVARASVYVTLEDELAALGLPLGELLLEPVELLSSLGTLEASVVIVVHILALEEEDGDGVAQIHSVVTSRHECILDGGCERGIARVACDPQVVKVVEVGFLLALVGCLTVPAVVVAHRPKHLSVWEVLLKEAGTRFEVLPDGLPVRGARVVVVRRGMMRYGVTGSQNDINVTEGLHEALDHIISHLFRWVALDAAEWSVV
mmetsp:Transcript_15023/g.18993  ORF Transcript_15023/g.18993 Transcript_15023/m.18993 type:complete len:259 (+) Transcript_15023:574-1350(+)